MECMDTTNQFVVTIFKEMSMNTKARYSLDDNHNESRNVENIWVNHILESLTRCVTYLNPHNSLGRSINPIRLCLFNNGSKISSAI